MVSSHKAAKLRPYKGGEINQTLRRGSV